MKASRTVWSGGKGGKQSSWLLKPYLSLLLIIPEDEHPDVAELIDMLDHGNRVIVDEEDVLSDRVFHYCASSQRLCIAVPDAT